ncbi:ribosome maturation factor RimP [Acetobacterium bakii]|uniref:Ribosome maturation factor RimP n=1 Tax=Acetobacterium bakii TaxID=52689 RepID=A0A0L6TZF0_9FIRM|nr:ribosome maturation factor RimP [Acetobacterium bakii]KNZ41651.1 ribosome maturation factor RimP [Acetobacterium bakii]
MKKVSKEVLLEDLTAPVVESLGYELADLIFEKRGKDWALVLFIDSDHGINMDDCEIVSRAVSDVLDESDPIEQSYFLEVSSPGIDRPIKKERHYLANINKKITIRLFAPLDGKKDYSGVLKSYTTEALALELETGEILNIENSKIAKANVLDELNFKPQPKAE